MSQKFILGTFTNFFGSDFPQKKLQKVFFLKFFLIQMLQKANIALF